MRTLAILLALQDVSYLLLDTESGQMNVSHWEDCDRAIPLGSLVKPFTALAYGSAHAFRYPEFACDGKSCWLPRGHGRIGIVEAVAHSCNAYFRALAEQVHVEDLRPVLIRFGLSGPTGDGSLIGFGDTWKIPPIDMARAYAELARREAEPGVREVLAGLALSAKAGTGRGVGLAVLIKTGTAPCVHARRSVGDGYAIALDSHRVLLVRVHEAPGAEAAVAAGRILRVVR